MEKWILFLSAGVRAGDVAEWYSLCLAVRPWVSSSVTSKNK
jgi:hypothetical protein